MMICSLPAWPLLSVPPFIGVFSNERTAEPPPALAGGNPIAPHY